MKGNATLEISDEALMLKYAKGDVGAFERLLERHRRPLFGYLCRMLKNRELAEDTFQEVFLRVMNARTHYKKTAKFSTWLYRIAHNACIDALRRGSYRKTESLSAPANAAGDSDFALQDAIPSPNPGPDVEFDRKQFSQTLKKCIARLNPDQREVFALRQYQDIPFREIARVTGVTESTAKSRMRYALKALRAMLIEEKITEEVTT
jgi:RNA polymerase sigma-70 factor (ECF subfamily)